MHKRYRWSVGRKQPGASGVSEVGSSGFLSHPQGAGRSELPVGCLPWKVPRPGRLVRGGSAPPWQVAGDRGKVNPRGGAGIFRLRFAVSLSLRLPPFSFYFSVAQPRKACVWGCGVFRKSELPLSTPAPDGQTAAGICIQARLVLDGFLASPAIHKRS